ncbi:MAG: SdpI family protein [Anaerolineales bacterium]|nr:SdpI family protein [Anaerolineales bacterium]
MLSQPFTIPALLFLLFALPLILGLVPPNKFYGIRDRRSLDHRDVWYRTNRVGGSALVLSSLIYLLIAAVFPSNMNGQTDFGRWLIHIIVFIGALFVSLGIIRKETRK